MNANTSGRRRRDKKFVIIKSDVVNDDHSMNPKLTLFILPNTDMQYETYHLKNEGKIE